MSVHVEIGSMTRQYFRFTSAGKQFVRQEVRHHVFTVAAKCRRSLQLRDS